MPRLCFLGRLVGACFGTRRRLLLVVFVVSVSTLLAVPGIRFARGRLLEREARRALADYDFQTSRRLLERAGQLLPRRAEIWLLAAQAARRAGFLHDAQDYLSRYESLAGVLTSEGLLEDQLQKVQAGDIERHVPTLITLADAGHPATEQILEALVVGSAHVYHLDRTGFWLHHLLSRFPKNPVGRLARARMDDTLGKRESAETRCRELLVDFPDHWDARMMLAGLLFRTQRFAEAAHEYDRLRVQRPDELAPLLGLARCRIHLGPPEIARELLDELVQRFPNSGEVQLEAGRFLLNQNRPLEAEPLLRRAVEVAPHSHEAHYQLALCLERLGYSNEARHHLQRFRQIESDLTRLEELLARIVKFPRDPAPRREAGLICLRNGALTEAFRWLSGALEIAPDDRPTHEALAQYYGQIGDANRATYHWRKAW